MSILFIIISTLFIIQIIAELVLIFYPLSFSSSSPVSFPKVSILLVVRDEEENIERCLQSLIDQDYPNFEILIANDRSVDRTPEILERMETNANVRWIKETLEIPYGINPKAKYLQLLTDHSTGEYIAVTDGDCTYSSKWLKSMVTYKGDNHIVSGVTGIENARMEDMEWRISIGRITVLSKMGFNTSAVGNNMLCNKDSLIEVGGWNRVVNHLTEDFAIHQLFYQKGLATKILFIPETLVISKSTPLLARFNQRKRWMKGVADIQWMVKAMVYLQSLMLPLIVLSLFFFPYYGSIATGLYLLLKVTSDGRLLLRIKYMNVFHIVLYQGYHLLWNFSFLVYTLFSGSIKWKGTKY